MKKPDEIKKGLEFASTDCEGAQCCDKTCAYYKECGGYHRLAEVPCTMICDALAYIQQLERELAAALYDMNRAQCCICNICKKHYRPDPEVRRYSCQEYGDDFTERICSEEEVMLYCSAFEWRGVCADNTKEADIRLNNTAHWIMHEDDLLGLTCECSNCHIETCGDTPYCPHCGKRMVREDD